MSDNGTSIIEKTPSAKPQPTPQPQAVAFAVPLETMNKLLNHLAKSPWGEVNPLMVELSNCKPVER